MENESVKQRLMRLYLEAYEILLKKMNLKETYSFRFYTLSNEFKEGIGEYIDDIIRRNDYLFQDSSDSQIRMYFAVLANESIHEYLEFLADDAFTYYADVGTDEHEQEVMISDQ